MRQVKLFIGIDDDDERHEYAYFLTNKSDQELLEILKKSEDLTHCYWNTDRDYNSDNTNQKSTYILAEYGQTDLTKGQMKKLYDAGLDFTKIDCFKECNKQDLEALIEGDEDSKVEDYMIWISNDDICQIFAEYLKLSCSDLVFELTSNKAETLPFTIGGGIFTNY